MTAPLYDFDAIIPRRATDCLKWDRYPDDVLPMWVADMDFAVAQEIVDALRARLGHPVFGYGFASDALRQRIVDDMAERYGWTISPEAIVFLSGVVPGFNMALRATVPPGGAVVIETPVYPPILAAAGHAGLQRIDVEVVAAANRYASDVDALAAAMKRAGAFLMCNPHNPAGQVKTKAELEAIADAALTAGATIVSDEIHCDFIYGGHRHIPIASLSPEIAARTVTLMAASKTYNIAGLATAFAIVPDAELRRKFAGADLGMGSEPNGLGLVATLAAFEHGGPWKAAVLSYLEANRDYFVHETERRLPGVRVLAPEGTFLAWLDCTGLALGQPAQRFFLEQGRVAFNPGEAFGAGKEGFVRLNFGCPRSLVDDGLNRMARALAGR